MRLKFIHLNLNFRQGYFRDRMKIRSCKRVLSDSGTRFGEHSNRLSYHRPSLWNPRSACKIFCTAGNDFGDSQAILRGSL